MNEGLHFFSLLPLALSVTAPIFIIISLGMWLAYIKFINQEFIRITSKIIFNIGLPLMLFTSTSSHDFSQLINVTHLTLLLTTTLIIFIIANFSASKFIHKKEDKGVFVQGAFRGNLVIIGLALCDSAYPDKGIAIAALPTAMIIIVYNLLSIYTLNASLHQQKFSLKKNLEDIIKNPLIIGILSGLLVNFVAFPMPKILVQSNNYLTQMTLPLALLSIGGSLNFLQLKQNITPALMASLGKVLLCPIVFILLLLIWPTDPVATGVLFLLMASPTAGASFIMVKAMNGNSDLAAKIIIISTLMSLFTVTLGFALLVSTGLVTV